MIRRLRMKFIVICLASLMLVIALVMGLLNFLNYRKMMEGADNLLDLLVENSGRIMPPETPYATRFFSVKMDESGKILAVDTENTAAMDDETAEKYALGAWKKGKQTGFAGNYRYRRAASEEGFLIVFLDCSREIDNAKSVLLTSAGVSIVALFLVFALIYVFSGIVMKPVYESYEKQKRFITDAGHEIKTPLTTIGADLDVLELEIGENEWLEDMRRQTKRLAVLTNELIYLAKMEEGGSKIPLIALPFSDLVEETAQSFQALAIMENKIFQVNIQEMVIIRGEEQALRKLVSILLDNAVKHSSENESILLTLEKSGKTIRLAVENTVRNMSAETVSHLFERFYREDASRNSGKGGYGIGLSIAEAIVKAHKGEIKAALLKDSVLRISVQFPARSEY